MAAAVTIPSRVNVHSVAGRQKALGKRKSTSCVSELGAGTCAGLKAPGCSWQQRGGRPQRPWLRWDPRLRRRGGRQPPVAPAPSGGLLPFRMCLRAIGCSGHKVLAGTVCVGWGGRWGSPPVVCSSLLHASFQKSLEILCQRCP